MYYDNGGVVTMMSRFSELINLWLPMGFFLNLCYLWLFNLLKGIAKLVYDFAYNKMLLQTLDICNTIQYLVKNYKFRETQFTHLPW